MEKFSEVGRNGHSTIQRFHCVKFFFASTITLYKWTDLNYLQSKKEFVAIPNSCSSNKMWFKINIFAYTLHSISEMSLSFK